MANRQQLYLLHQGTQVWNTWRNTHPEIHIDLNRAELSGANLTGADLSRANLIGAELNEADLSETELSEAYLSRADLSEAYLSGARLSGARLSGTRLSGANLSGANLSEANLSEADLSRANLSGANLNGADLRLTTIGWTIFGDVDLRRVKGLETVKHEGPSTIGTDTLIRSQGDIPRAFLRGIGLPDTFLEYVPLLNSRPIEYSTCFLSYSSQDIDFAKRLHADLQQHGVQCWFAPHRLRPGELMLAHIDKAIRLYDQLILILSQYSVESHWVDMEATAARTKEAHQGSQMLFPLRLDDIVMSTTTAWTTSLREQRHIADFTNWKDDDAYQVAFDLLLRALKPAKKT